MIIENYRKKSQKYLHISKKSSTFALEIESRLISPFVPDYKEATNGMQIGACRKVCPNRCL